MISGKCPCGRATELHPLLTGWYEVCPSCDMAGPSIMTSKRSRCQDCGDDLDWPGGGRCDDCLSARYRASNDPSIQVLSHTDAAKPCHNLTAGGSKHYVKLPAHACGCGDKHIPPRIRLDDPDVK